jgi:hypothetical protein
LDIKDIISFQMKRVNPFSGLAIDADTWRDAHNYHRDQQRLHNILFHEYGIILGLEVTANDPPDYSVNISPGAAMDPQGNIIIVRNIYHYQIQNRDKKTIFLIIQFREILDGPYQPPEGGQPTRIIDGYRIQERDNLPDEPFLELARIEFDPDGKAINIAIDKTKPLANEINLRFRREVNVISRSKSPENITGEILKSGKTNRMISIGYALVDGARSEQHICGLRNLSREVEMRYNWMVNFEENVNLDKNISKYNILYLTGDENFRLSQEQTSVIETFLNSKGLLIAEDCSEGETKRSRSRKSNPVYHEIIKKLNPSFKPVIAGNDLLSNINVFSEVPCGIKSGVFLKEENLIYTDNDYGCAWQGGHRGSPITRETIRDAFEIGTNICEYAYQNKMSLQNK